MQSYTSFFWSIVFYEFRAEPTTRILFGRVGETNQGIHISKRAKLHISFLVDCSGEWVKPIKVYIFLCLQSYTFLFWSIVFYEFRAEPTTTLWSSTHLLNFHFHLFIISRRPTTMPCRFLTFDNSLLLDSSFLFWTRTNIFFWQQSGFWSFDLFNFFLNFKAGPTIIAIRFVNFDHLHCIELWLYSSRTYFHRIWVRGFESFEKWNFAWWVFCDSFFLGEPTTMSYGFVGFDNFAQALFTVFQVCLFCRALLAGYETLS